jgi:WD40 repeat protein
LELSRDLSKLEMTGDSAPDKSTSGSPPQVPPNSHEKAVPFDSFATLINAHTELLKVEISQNDSTRPHFIEQVNEFIRRGTQTGTLLYDTDQRRTAQSLLNYWVTVLYRAEATPPPDAILAYYSPREDLGFECPYVGLSPFRETDSTRFFGREQLTSNIVQRLVDKHFVVLVGLSGSGKTSALCAGVLPILKNGTLVPETKEWTYLPSFTPGSDPLSSLASLFTEDVKPEADRLLQKPEHLLELVKQPSVGDRPIVFVIDQFEEVFTWTKDDQRRDAFINALMSLKDAPIKHRVILAMRSDRINQIIRRPVLNELFRDAEVRIDPLRETSLREIIDKPAQTIGLKFQPGVVDQIIREVYAEPVPLPLLQFALLELWSNREADTITWSAINKLGDFREALAAKAESFYDSLDPEEQAVTRRIVLRMVRLSNTWEATSEPVRRDDLYQSGDDSKRVNEVLAKLLSANLVRISNIGRWLSPSSTGSSETPLELPDDQFELSHESLARTWPELGNWLRTLRESLATRQRLGLYAANWVILGRSDKGLLDNYQLHEAEKWLRSQEAKELGYDADLEGLVLKSRETINRAKLMQKLRWVGLAALILFGLGLIVVAFVAGQQHRLSQETAFRLSLQAGALRGNQLDLALLLNREAYLKDRTIAEAQNSLMRSLTYSPKLRSYLFNEKGSIKQIAFSEDGSRLSLFDSSGKVTLWRATNGYFLKDSNERELGEQLPGAKAAPDDTSLPRLSRNGKYLFYMEGTDQLVLRDLETGENLKAPTSTKKAAGSPLLFACSNDSTKLAWLTPVVAEKTSQASEAFELTVWDLAGQKRLASRSTKRLQNIGFSPDNKTLAVANPDQTITLLPIKDLGSVGRTLKDASNEVGSKKIVFSADGNNLVSINRNGELGVWSTQDQTLKGTFSRHAKRGGRRHLPQSSGEAPHSIVLSESETSQPVPSAECFAISPQGDLLVAGYEDGTVIFWNVATGEQSEYTTRLKGRVSEILFSADGNKVITAADVEGPILLWERMPSRSLDISRNWQNTRELLGGLAGKIAKITFSRDSKLIAAVNVTGGDDNGTVILWDLDQNMLTEGTSLPGVGNPQAFSDNGLLSSAASPSYHLKLFTFNESDEVVLTDLQTRAEEKRFSIKSDSLQPKNIGSHVREVAFNKNGKVLAARYQDNSVAIWDTANGQGDVILSDTGDRPGDSIIGMAIADLGDKIAIGRSGGGITVLEIKDRKVQKVQKVKAIPDDAVSSLTLIFSADGLKLASSDNKGTITIWDTVNGNQLVQRSGKDQTQSYRLAFTKDGTKLVYLTGDTLTLWNPSGSDEEILTKSLNISNFVLNPVSDSVAAIGNDGSILFWDLSKWADQFTFAPRDVASLSGGNSLTSLIYVPDGTKLVAGYSDGSIRMIVLDLDLWANRACSIANRSLTQAEQSTHDVFADHVWNFWSKPSPSKCPNQ